MPKVLTHTKIKLDSENIELVSNVLAIVVGCSDVEGDVCTHHGAECQWLLEVSSRVSSDKQSTPDESEYLSEPVVSSLLDKEVISQEQQQPEGQINTTNEQVNDSLPSVGTKQKYNHQTQLEVALRERQSFLQPVVLDSETDGDVSPSVSQQLSKLFLHHQENQQDIQSCLHCIITGGPCQAIIAGIDVETDVAIPSHPNENDDTLVGIGISANAVGFYFTMESRGLKVFKKFLPQIQWAGHNSKYDYVILKRHGFIPGPIVGDGMLGLYLLGQREAKLKDAVLARYNYKMTTYEELSQGGKLKISQADPAKTFDYNLDDCIWGRRLALDVEAELSEKALKVYHTLDLPLVSILGDIQIAGFQLDREHAEEEQAKHTKQQMSYDVAIRMIAENEGFIRPPKRRVCRTCHNGKNKKLNCDDCNQTGECFEPQPLNPSSNDQLVEFLHHHLRLPVQDLTDSKQPSISKLALLKMKELHDVIPLLIKRRAGEKYLGYLREWLARSAKDGRIHTLLTNAWVRSGRLSSRDPNLTQVKLAWRDNFIAPKDVPGEECHCFD